MILPLWPSKGFWGFCMYEIRSGLMFRYWITLPKRYKAELEFRREMDEMFIGLQYEDEENED